MIEVWQDAEVPVEYRAPELHFQNWGKIGFFGNLIQTISPLIIIVISLLFVVMSYYVAPSTLLIKEKPTVYPPFYYLAVGNLDSNAEDQSTIDNTTRITSFLYSNFPQFTKGDITSFNIGGRCMSAVTDTGYLDVQIDLPFNYPDKNLIHLTILLPITINFPKIEHKNVHTIINFQVSQDKIRKVHTVGRFLFTQQRAIAADEKYQRDSMQDVLSDLLKVDDTQPFDIDYILLKFANMSFTSKIVKISETIEKVGQSNSPVSVHLEIRIPEIFAEIKAPFWNMFKVTYVQLFYWFWLVYFVWNVFIRTGFVYGIIPSTVFYVLKPAKKKMD